MAEEAQAAQAPAPALPVYADELTPMSALDALSHLRAERATEKPKDEDEPATPAEADAGAEQQESADEANAAAQDEPSGEDNEGQDDAPELEPIDPPSSWTKEERKHWEALPRDLQEHLAERERTRRAEFDRRHNEASRLEQSAKTREDAAEQARKAYEDRLPAVVELLNSNVNNIVNQMKREFPDVKTLDDLDRMATEDPIAHSRWQAYERRLLAEQNRANAATAEAQQAKQRQDAEANTKKQTFFNEQIKLFNEKAPEFADPDKGPALRAKVMQTVTNYGFTPEEVDSAWKSGDFVSMHDHRLQLMIAALARFESGQKEAAKAKPVAKQTTTATKPAPVQRPGVAESKKGQQSEYVKGLDNRLSKTGSIRDAVALIRATR